MDQGQAGPVDLQDRPGGLGDPKQPSQQVIGFGQGCLELLDGPGDHLTVNSHNLSLDPSRDGDIQGNASTPGQLGQREAAADQATRLSPTLGPASGTARWLSRLLGGYPRAGCVWPSCLSGATEPAWRGTGGPDPVVRPLQVNPGSTAMILDAVVPPTPHTAGYSRRAVGTEPTHRCGIPPRQPISALEPSPPCLLYRAEASANPAAAAAEDGAEQTPISAEVHPPGAEVLTSAPKPSAPGSNSAPPAPWSALGSWPRRWAQRHATPAPVAWSPPWNTPGRPSAATTPTSSRSWKQPRAVDAGKRGLGQPARHNASAATGAARGCQEPGSHWVCPPILPSPPCLFERGSGRRTVVRVVPDLWPLGQW